MTAHPGKHAAVWLGIDLGTQSVRAMAVAETGEVVGQGAHPLSSRRDGLRHEQDPEQLWRALAMASRSALAGVPSSSVRGLAVDGTSGTILIVDGSGRPLTAALMYDDGRAQEEARRVNEIGAAVWASLGYRMQGSWALPKLLWLLHAHKIPLGARLVHQTDFINRRLAGEEVPSDSSNALKTGYDLIHDRWPHDVLQELAVPEEIMPDVVHPGVQIGTVCREAADLTGIPEGAPILAGMTDSCAAQIAAGALEIGNWNSVLGTTLVLRGVTKELLRDPAGIVYSHRAPDGNWLPGGASSTGAGILAERFRGRDLDALSVQAAAHEPASVVAYPLASARGERFPFVQPEAEGFVLGEPEDENDLFAAILQGVAFVERLAFDYLDFLGAGTVGEVRFTGGATRNRYWCQLRADILERSVCLPEVAEAALGMAILAAAKDRPLAQAAGQMVRIREVIDPRAKSGLRLREAYLRLVEELSRRSWAPTALAEHARRRAA